MKKDLDVYINELIDYSSVIAEAYSPRFENGKRVDTIRAEEKGYKESLQSFQKKLEDLAN